MTFTKRLHEGVRRGEITCSVRVWTRPDDCVYRPRLYYQASADKPPKCAEGGSICQGLSPMHIFFRETNIAYDWVRCA